MNLDFIKEFDIIYLYRPIESIDKCNILFDLLYENMKDTCKIIYLLPHQFNYNHLRKFDFIIKNKYISGFTKCSILKKKGNNIRNIDIGDIINKSLTELDEFEKSTSKHADVVTIQFDGDKTPEFINSVKKSIDILKNNDVNLVITYGIYRKTQTGYAENKYGIIKKYNTNQFINDVKNSNYNIVKLNFKYIENNGNYSEYYDMW